MLAIDPCAPGVFASNEWLLAFEDLARATGDRDFDEFAVLVESVRPVPEPSAAATFVAGLAVLGALGRARRRA